MLSTSRRNLAADAFVGQANHVGIHPDNEFGVNIDGAKIVGEHSHAQAVIPGQDAIQQRCLPRAEKAGDDRQQNAFAIVVYDLPLGLKFPLEKAPAFIFLSLRKTIPIILAIPTRGSLRSTHCKSAISHRIKRNWVTNSISSGAARIAQNGFGGTNPWGAAHPCRPRPG